MYFEDCREIILILRISSIFVSICTNLIGYFDETYLKTFLRVSEFDSRITWPVHQYINLD